MKLKPGDIVRIKDPHSIIRNVFNTGSRLSADTEFQVVLSGENILAYNGLQSGVVIQMLNSSQCSYPYVWNESRFEFVKHEAI